ncbi:MAG: hypothetical protein ACSHX0_05550 [Akkermansiaceae bacterium]
MKNNDDTNSEQPTLKSSEPPIVLKVDKNDRFNSRSIQPEVSQILNQDAVVIDTEEAWGTSQKKSKPLMGWVVIGGLILLASIVWMYTKISQPLKNNSDTVAMLDVLDEKKEIKDKLAKLQNTISGYEEATTVEEKSQFVRHPERVLPLMKEYYSRVELVSGSFKTILTITDVDINRNAFVYLNYITEDYSKRLLLLEKLEEKSYLVDWESTVSYSPLFWSDFVKTRPKQPLDMRVYLAKAHYYLREFRDEEIYDCYKITALNSQDVLFGYVTKQSDTGQALDKYMRLASNNGGASKQAMTVTLRFPEESSSNKFVLIDHLITDGWTITEKN